MEVRTAIAERNAGGRSDERNAELLAGRLARRRRGSGGVEKCEGGSQVLLLRASLGEDDIARRVD